MTPFGKINPVNNNLRYTPIKFINKPCFQKEKIFLLLLYVSTLRFFREINRSDFPLEIFGFCLFDLYGNNNSIQFKEIRETLGSYFVLTNEGLEIIIEKLCLKYPEFIFNDDAGIRQLQVKSNTENFKLELLQKYYHGV